MKTSVQLTCPHCGSDDTAAIKSDPSRMRCLECGESFMRTGESNIETFKPLRLFLSYGHPEAEIVRRIKEALEKRGHSVWFDESEIRAGHDWRERIAEGVRSSNGVVACLSRHSVRNPGVCLDELAIAVGIHGGNVKTVLLGSELEVDPPASVAHVQWVDMHDWKERLEQGGESFDEWFDKRMAELINGIESDESHNFIRDMGGIREALHPIVDDSKQRELLNRGFVGRGWLAEKVVEWLDDRSSPRVCLLTGAPGIGKSAFVAHFAHYGSKMRSSVAAAVFCEANRPMYNDASQVLRTLAYLLACRIPEYRADLAVKVRERSDLFEMNEDELFSFLLADPLTRSVDGNRECLCIVIDGIDEAGDTETNALAEALGRYAKRLPTWIKILVVSRHVSSAVDPIVSESMHIDMDAFPEDSAEDVRHYLFETLGPNLSNEPMYDECIEAIVSSSKGSMLYASVIAEAIMKGKTTLAKARSGLPEGLSSTFYQWFVWTFPNANEYRNDFREPLGCLLAAPNGSLPIEEMRRLFGWSRNRVNDFTRRLEVFIRPCKTLLGGDSLAISHAFLSEWIGSEAAGAFQADIDDGVDELAKAFLSYLDRGAGCLTDYEANYVLDLAKRADKEDAYEMARCNSELIERLAKLCTELMNIGKLTEGEAVASKALKHCRGAERLPRASLAKLLTCESHLLSKLNKRFGAGRLCQEALVILIELAKEEPGLYLPRVARLYNELANLLNETGFSLQAEPHHLEALRIQTELSESDASHLPDLAVTCNDLANMLVGAGRTEEAEGLFREALRIRRDFANADASYLPDLAVTCNDLANMLVGAGRTEEAEGLFREALRIRKDLAKTQSASFYLDVAATCNDFGSLMCNLGHYEEAKSLLYEALNIRLELSEAEPEAYLPDVCETYHELAHLFEVTGYIPEAEMFYKRELEVLEKLYRASEFKYREVTAISYNALGNLLLSYGNEEEAISCYLRIIEICEGSVQETSKLLAEQARQLLAVYFNDDSQVDSMASGSNSADDLAELRFIAVDDFGREVECDALFMFESPETGKSYVVYTDNTVDDGGNVRVYASAYNPESLINNQSGEGNKSLAKFELYPLQTQQEWAIIETILTEMQRTVSDEYEDEGYETEEQTLKVESHDIIRVDIAGGVL